MLDKLFLRQLTILNQAKFFAFAMTRATMPSSCLIQLQCRQTLKVTATKQRCSSNAKIYQYDIGNVVMYCPLHNTPGPSTNHLTT